MNFKVQNSTALKIGVFTASCVHININSIVNFEYVCYSFCIFEIAIASVPYASINPCSEVPQKIHFVVPNLMHGPSFAMIGPEGDNSHFSGHLLAYRIL